MSGVDPNRAGGDADDFAAYVVAMTGEMARLARSRGFRTLAYLLEIVRLEARSITRTTPPARRSQVPSTPAAPSPASGVMPPESKFSAVGRGRR